MNNLEPGKRVNAQVKENVARIAKFNDLDLVYIFGSWVTGTNNQMSDVDIAVLLSNASLPRNMSGQKAHLIVEFGRVFKTDNLDLAILNTAPFSLAFTVVKEGVLLFSANENLREKFEMRALLNYFDFQPFEALYFREMKNQIHHDGGTGH